MKKVKSLIACVASLCLISSFAFSAVSADENQTVNGPSDSLGSVSDIAADIINPAVTTAVTTEATVISGTTTASEVSAEVTAAAVTDITSDVTTSAVTEITSAVTTAETTVTTAVPAHVNDIVIGLDISGSMSGEPLKAMKDAAIEFCEYVIANDPGARIAVVPFASSVKPGVSYTNDVTELTTYISGMRASGGTDYAEAMQQIVLQLKNGSGEKKNVVFMADGLPNEGLRDTSDEYKAQYPDYDAYEKGALKIDNEEVKPGANVYTVGFFHSLNGSSKDHAEKYMKDLASSQTQYFNADVSSLKEVFAEIADEIVIEVTTVAYQAPAENENEKAESSAAAVTTTAAETKANATPKTADSRNIAPALTAAFGACAAIALTKKKKED